jgi:hypothetical protein
MTEPFAEHDNYLGPFNKLRWQDAIKKRARIVEMTDGRKFSLKYGTDPKQDNKPTVRFTPTWSNIAVPRGTWDVEFVESSAFIGPDASQISKNAHYIEKLNEFIDSDMTGVCVTEHWPHDFQGLLNGTIKRNFDHARHDRLTRASAPNIKVMIDDDKVYLVKPPDFAAN